MISDNNDEKPVKKGKASSIMTREEVEMLINSNEAYNKEIFKKVRRIRKDASANVDRVIINEENLPMINISNKQYKDLNKQINPPPPLTDKQVEALQRKNIALKVIKDFRSDKTKAGIVLNVLEKQKKIRTKKPVEPPVEEADKITFDSDTEIEQPKNEGDGKVSKLFQKKKTNYSLELEEKLEELDKINEILLNPTILQSANRLMIRKKIGGRGFM